MKWFRVYTDILDNPKIADMSPKTFKTFIFLLAFCSQLDNSGTISVTKDKPKWRFRMRKRDWDKSINELHSLKIIDLQGDDIYILNWNKRQYKSDDVSKRVKRFRAKNVTLQETLQVTTPDTDTDTQKQKKKRRKPDLSETISNKWNEFAKQNNLATILKVGDKRKQNIRKRLSEKEFDFDAILSEISRSDFLLGLKKPWKVSFDFIFNSTNNYLKILEGAYRNDDSAGKTDEQIAIEKHNKRVLNMWNVKEG